MKRLWTRSGAGLGLALAALLGCMPPLVAAERSRAETRAEFAALRAVVEQEVREGEKYAELTPDQLQEVRTRLDRMESILAATGSIELLSEPEKVAFFNDQEAVNAILTQAEEDSRLVCRREHKIGSRVPVNECFTLAERRRAQIEASNAVGELMKRGEVYEAPGAGGQSILTR